MSGFPDNFRDLTAFSGDGLDYSTTSNTAIKMYDALVHQVRDTVMLSSSCHSLISGHLSLRQPPVRGLGRHSQGDVLC